jgi:xylulose-5-phosphate/fructose-6-phosphate phosphoketolase
MKSYRPELFDDSSRLRAEQAERPQATVASANPRNGGLLLRELRLPNFRDTCRVTEPGAVMARSTRVMGQFLRDVMKLNMEHRISGSSV